MKTLKELRAERSTKAALLAANLKAFNTLGAVATRTEAQDAELTGLDAKVDAGEAEINAIDSQISALERGKRVGLLIAARGAGRVDDADPVRTGGFKSIAEFGVSVRNAAYGTFDDRLAPAPIDANAPATYQQNQGSAGEGYLVPPEFSKFVWDMALDNTDLLGMAEPEPTASNAIGKPKDETTPWGSAGVQAYWASEAGLYTPSKLALTGEMMTLHKLFAFVAATDELLSDAPMLRNRLSLKSGQAISWKSSDAVMWGTGAGMPTGFMNSPALITVAKDNSQVAATLSLANLLNMLRQVLRIGGKPVWIINQDTIAQLAQLTIGNFPVWLPMASGIHDSPFDGFLLGYPVLFTEHAQTLGTSGDVVCANMAGYYAAVKQGGINFAESMHLYFDQGLTAFRWTFRLAGQPVLSKPVSPARGATTKSHFVALATRA